MRISCFLIFPLFIYAACSPATSDVFVEVVNPELVKKLIAQADSVIEVPADAQRRTLQPFWVNGKRLVFTNTSKSTVLWLDEQEKISGILEYENEKLKDSIAFFPNGQRMFTIIIDKTGKASGPARYYYPDGRVREDGRFTGGLKTGIWRQFNEEGRLQKTTEYKKDGSPLRK